MGATARDVLTLVVTQAIPPVGVGLAGGLAASVALTPVLDSMLVGVSPTDPLTYAVASSVLIVSAILGCMVSARHAMRVDPAVALKHE